MIRASKRTGGTACRVGGRVTLACTAALMVLSAAAWGAERADPTPQPWVTMSLASLGVPAIPPAFLQSGSSMLTLDMVDDTHLLLTFSSRGLVPRVPGDPPDDEDRMVAAELVELPSGKILARTDWHMHDHARYLWRLGKGRFLVRTRHELFVITPEARLNTADPLRPMRFPTREGKPVFAVVSPDKGMVMVETMAPPKKGKVDTTGGGVIVTDPRPEVLIDFYRMSGGDAPGVPLTMSGAGMVKAPAPVMLPMDADGYLWPNDAKHGQWPVSFNEFGGREVKIANVDSSCPPRLQMVSRFEFLAFTCGGTEARVRLKSYGMDGHETWEDTLGGTYGVPELTFAPEAGRFALSRIMSPTGDLNLGQVIPDGATQEVRVYQTESGDLLLKVPTNPVTRYAENFDMTEDGLVAAVVNAGLVQVYKLPPPSAQDVKDLAEAKSFSPPVSHALVNFAKLEQVSGEGNSESSSAAADVAAAAKPSLAGTTGSGGGGGSAEPPPAAVPAAAAPPVAAAPPATADAAVATQGGLAGASPAAELKTASATKDPADEISDEEAAKALGARLAVSQPATKNVAGGAGGSAKVDSGPKAAAARDVAGGDAQTGRRKPPTLLGPGENVEKVKSPTQQSQSR